MLQLQDANCIVAASFPTLLHNLASGLQAGRPHFNSINQEVCKNLLSKFVLQHKHLSGPYEGGGFGDSDEPPFFGHLA